MSGEPVATRRSWVRRAGSSATATPSYLTGRIAGCLAWPAVCLVAVAVLGGQGDDPKRERDRAKLEAAVLWVGLAIVSVLLLGLGLIWGVSRGARFLRRKQRPVHTEMPDIWFLNPPEKRKQDEP